MAKGVIILISELDAIVRLMVAVILGGIVGFERQSRNKSAGLRTHILVSLGSCLTMIVSLNISLNFYFIYGLTNADPERIAAQVISGIGFLGAGTILANKKGLNVIGLTTAASLWVVAAIGLASGAGYWITASATTLFVYLTLAIMSPLEKRIRAYSPTTCQYDFVITTASLPGQIGIISDCVCKKGVSIREFHTLAEDEKNRLIIFISTEAPMHITASQIISALLTVEGITAVKKDMALESD
jgi:putative Mg2+ transporter-C (MgtC) family protein